MLELEDIQHILLTRAPALTGRYEFLSFADPAGGRAWLAAIRGKVHSAKTMRESVDAENRWITVAFTWNGLRALGVDESGARKPCRRNFARAWWRGPPSSATPEAMIRPTGSIRPPARTFMPL